MEQTKVIIKFLVIPKLILVYKNQKIKTLLNFFGN